MRAEEIYIGVFVERTMDAMTLSRGDMLKLARYIEENGIDPPTAPAEDTEEEPEGTRRPLFRVIPNTLTEEEREMVKYQKMASREFAQNYWR